MLLTTITLPERELEMIPPKQDRWKGLNARQRYDREYRECRIFNTYKTNRCLREIWRLGDQARVNGFLSWCQRPDEIFQEYEDHPSLEG